MKPKVYQLIERCVRDGMVVGYNHHNKHKDVQDPFNHDLTEDQIDAIMLEISEWFTFTDEELGVVQTD